MELDHLPIIDWEQGKKLAGNRIELAKEFLTAMLARLSKDVQTICLLFNTQNYIEMWREVHKLHGALCYCGLPRLKKVISDIELSLKNNNLTHLFAYLEQLKKEVILLSKLDTASIKGFN